jgi:hypothetical protein
MIWKLLMVAQQTFRKLNAPDKLIQVYACQQFKDGVLIPIQPEEQLKIAA